MTEEFTTEKDEQVATWRWRITKAGFNVSKFAEHIGIPQSQLSDWVNKKRRPKKANAKKVERALKKLGV